MFTRTALRNIVLSVGAAGALPLGGCGDTSVALAHKDLAVHSTLDSSLMLPILSDKTFALAVRNSTKLPLDAARMQRTIARALQAEGYTEMAPEQAHFVVQLAILRSTTDAAAAGANGGGLLGGAALGGVNGTGQGALIGGVVDTVAGALVRNVTVDVISQLQIGVRQPRAVRTEQTTDLSEGSGGSQTQHLALKSPFVFYRTEIRTTANQVDLRTAAAVAPIERAIERNVVGLF